MHRAANLAIDPAHLDREPKVSRHEATLSDPVEALILDLLEWIGPKPRPYSEVMEAWRTSCPRLPVWEEANDRGLVERCHDEGVGVVIAVTCLGRELLARQQREDSPLS